MSPRANSIAAFLAALGVISGCALGMTAAIRAYGIHLRKLPIYPPEGRLLLGLPVETASWKRVGQDRVETPETIKTLGTENYVSRIYVEKNPPEGREPRGMEFHAAYYTGMIDTVPHVPDRCFVGGGLQIGDRAQVLPLELDRTSWVPDDDVPEALRGRVFTVRLANGEHSQKPGARVRLPFDPQDIRLRVVEFLDGRGGKLYAGYFFIANGGTVASAEGVRLLAFNLTDDHAYYLKVQFTSGQATSAQELAEDAASLLSELIGEIMLCVPDWVEVERGAYPPASDGPGT